MLKKYREKIFNHRNCINKIISIHRKNAELSLKTSTKETGLALSLQLINIETDFT